MKRKISILCTVLFFVNSICIAQWVSLDKNSLPNSEPNVQLISDDITGTIIKVDLSGFRVKEFISMN